MQRLEQEPKARVRSLGELMSLAAAMESEAIGRYALLAEKMARHGDHGLAATFQAMLAEERDHLEGIERWSQQMTGEKPREAAQPWQLPPEIAHSWDEVAGSASLTPYGALSIAVLNEERGFAFYSYLAAAAEDPDVRHAAEGLAAEELNHAALLRRERRRAWRRETAGRRASPAAPPTSTVEFGRRSRQIELEAAAAHGAVAARLADLGAAEEAAACETVAAAERRAAAAQSAPAEARPAPAVSAERLAGKNRTELLRFAMREAERIYDFYADLADHAGTESVLRAAQESAARAVHHLGLLAAQLHAPAEDPPR